MTVLIRTEDLEKKTGVSLDHVERIATGLLTLCGCPDAEVSILLVSDARIAALNAAYRQRPVPTNVLAFAIREGEGAGLVGSLLGDIVISVDTARREADRLGITLHRRLTALLVHGMLHLLGQDHEVSEEAALRMAASEAELIKHLEGERSNTMIRLAVNVDHVATIRQARGGAEPDPVLAAGICELAGAVGIVVHLREDRRHIQDRDVRLLRQTVKTKLNLEMAAAPEIIELALELKPDMVTLVPEKRKELTTEGGLNVARHQKEIAAVIKRMDQAGIPVSLFVDPDTRQIKAARNVGATFVEIHTGRYCDAVDEAVVNSEFDLVASAAAEAYESGLRVNAGHGLDYRNTSRIAAIPFIEELSIGHAIMARAVFVGLDQAVREMLSLMV